MTQDLEVLINGCQSNDRSAQEALYRRFYGYAMSLSLQYSKSRAEAEEIVHDGFMKVFTRMEQYRPDLDFKGWFRRIIINSAIDYFRSQKKHYYQEDIEEAVEMGNFDDNIIDRLSMEEITTAIQKLPPVYQMVFNLYVIEGYKHKEIAKKLGISEATSRSDLAKARNKLKMALSYLVI